MSNTIRWAYVAFLKYGCRVKRNAGPLIMTKYNDIGEAHTWDVNMIKIEWLVLYPYIVNRY